jgi:very-short-patch-repair endonuclease
MRDSDSDATPPVLARDQARALRAAQTEVERRLWQRLRNRQLNGMKFRRQHPLGSYIADFFCLDARPIIELDGSQHGQERERRADDRRTEYLESQGYRVLRFWNEEVLDNMDGVLEVIARNL